MTTTEKEKARIWTEEEKTKMERMHYEEKLPYRQIGEHFGLSGRSAGDKIRKVLARRVSAPPAPQPPPTPPAQKKETAEAKLISPAEPPVKADKTAQPAAETPATTDRLARIHDEFDSKVPERRASRPKWAGRPPLKVTPKDFKYG